MASPPRDGLWHATRAFVGAVARFAGRRGMVAAGLVALGAALEGITVMLLVPILTLVTGQGAGTWNARISARLPDVGSDARLGVSLALFLAVMAVRAMVLHLRDLRLASLQAAFIADRRSRIVAAIARAPWERVAGLRHANVANLLTSEVSRVGASTHYLVQGGVAAAMLAAQAVLALTLAPALAAGVLGMMAIGGALIIATGTRSRDLGGAMIDANQAVMSSTAVLLGGLKVAAAQGSQAWFVAEFEAGQRDLSDRSLAFARRLSRSRFAFALGSAGAGAAVVWAGVASGLDAGVLITLIVVFARMAAPATVMQQTAQNIFHGVPSFEALEALEAKLARGTVAIAPVAPAEGDIALDGASYRHADGVGIARATLSIAAGTFVGISGPSGAGKTSLVDLIAGLVPPQEGTVSVGGVVLEEASRAGWRERIAYVAQDSFLFNDTVRRNLEWGTPRDNADIASALAITGADRIVAGLEQGLDTIVGERGARLSGGERQRLALSRALLLRPRLLVMDEATSAIDVISEQKILTSLAAMSPRPTILLVAHRAESLAFCDRILHIEDASISGAN